jgi:hypothetical protein
VILASILHLIRRHRTGNWRVPPCRTPPRWVPSCRAPARRRRRRPRTSGLRVATPPPQYWPMEPSPPRVPEQSLSGPPLLPFGVPYIPRSQVDLGRLTGPPEGATPFTVARLVRAPTIEQVRGSPAVEPLTRGTVGLSITDRTAIPYHRLDPPSPTREETNPNPNSLGSGSPLRISPLGNRIIHQVIQLPTLTCTQPVGGHSGAFSDARVRFHN